MGSLLIYISVFSFAAFFMSFSKKRSSLLGILGVAILIIFAAGRYFVGTDFYTYLRIFSRDARYGWSTFFDRTNEDILFHLVCRVTYNWGGRVLAWGTLAALVVVPVYLELKKQYSDMYFFAAFTAFVFFMYSGSFNVTREYVAVAIVFLSLKYVFENKFVKFAICIIVASLFHVSAAIAIVLWVFWSHKRNVAVTGKKKFFLICAAAIAVIGYQSIISFFASNISAFESYASYANEKAGGANRDFYLNLAVLVIILLCSKRLKRRDPRLEYMITLLIVGNLIGITGFFHPQVKRIAYYFSRPAQVIIFGYLPFCVPRLDKHVVTTLIFLYAVIRFTITAYILGQGHLIPYRFDLVS